MKLQRIIAGLAALAFALATLFGAEVQTASATGISLTPAGDGCWSGGGMFHCTIDVTGPAVQPYQWEDLSNATRYKVDYSASPTGGVYTTYWGYCAGGQQSRVRLSVHDAGGQTVTGEYSVTCGTWPLQIAPTCSSTFGQFQCSVQVLSGTGTYDYSWNWNQTTAAWNLQGLRTNTVSGSCTPGVSNFIDLWIKDLGVANVELYVRLSFVCTDMTIRRSFNECSSGLSRFGCEVELTGGSGTYTYQWEAISNASNLSWIGTTVGGYCTAGKAAKVRLTVWDTQGGRVVYDTGATCRSGEWP